MAVPFGTGDDGLPVGVQVLAPALRRADDVPRRGRARAGGRAETRRSTVTEHGDRAGRWSIGLEVHCELATATKLFCGCPNEFGDEPNTNICPVMPRPARLAAGAQRAGGRARDARRPGAATARCQPSIVPPQELLLSRHAEGLSDQPVRRADQRRRLARVDGTRVGIERAHLEEDTGKSHARRRRRAHPRRRLLAGRLQPRRRAAGRDRQPSPTSARPSRPGATSSELRGDPRWPSACPT